MKRIILHSDLNNFYASVECLLHPELEDKYVAVCGNKKDRHGIVLAKNQKAKLMGVSTGETIYEAQKKCPNLIIVPPTFDEYMKYSSIVRQIYLRYTNQVEPFGMDECWLDVTGSTSLFGSGKKIAEEIRCAVKKETGLTVSVGVSFNKVFSKLASDMKKPDAVTEIKEEDFKQKIWNLPASSILGVGRKFEKDLELQCIYTIGDIARTPLEFLTKRYGKNGRTVWEYANGKDYSPVADSEYVSPIKSIGNGITCTSDLKDSREVKNVILYLSRCVCRRLRQNNLMAGGVAISVKDNKLKTNEYQAQLPFSTVSVQRIADFAFSLFCSRHKGKNDIRSVSIRAINLKERGSSMQTSFFFDTDKIDKELKAEDAMEKIQNKFGKNSITYGSLLGDIKVPANAEKEIILPHSIKS